MLHVLRLMHGEKVWQEALLHETATPVHSCTSGMVKGITASSRQYTASCQCVSTEWSESPVTEEHVSKDLKEAQAIFLPLVLV